jgi:hypothetical protein
MRGLVAPSGECGAMRGQVAQSAVGDAGRVGPPGRNAAAGKSPAAPERDYGAVFVCGSPLP